MSQLAELLPVLLAVCVTQMTVDVMGVVTQVAALGTVKRKADQSEIARRDVTIVDKRCVEIQQLARAQHVCWIEVLHVAKFQCNQYFSPACRLPQQSVYVEYEVPCICQLPEYMFKRVRSLLLL